MNVAARELKNRLGAYLRRVKSGETVVVTDRGVPVAEIRPVEVEHLSTEDRLRRMSEAGDVSLPSGRPFARVKAIAVRGKSVSATLLQDRG